MPHGLEKRGRRGLLRAGFALLCFGVAGSAWAQPPADAGPGGRQRGGREGRRGGDPARGLERLDANADGKISVDEFSGPKEFFDQMDTDHDGSLSAEELASARNRFRGDGGRGDPARFQEMMLERLKESLGSDDEEWKVLQPRIQKVTEIQNKLRGAAGFGFRGMGGDRGGERPSGMPEADALRKGLEDKQTAPDKLTAALAAYREARKKTEAELQGAREEVRKLLTARQEATLVMAGILD